MQHRTAYNRLQPSEHDRRDLPKIFSYARNRKRAVADIENTPNLHDKSRAKHYAERAEKYPVKITGIFRCFCKISHILFLINYMFKILFNLTNRSVLIFIVDL